MPPRENSEALTLQALPEDLQKGLFEVIGGLLEKYPLGEIQEALPDIAMEISRSRMITEINIATIESALAQRRQEVFMPAYPAMPPPHFGHPLGYPTPFAEGQGPLYPGFPPHLGLTIPAQPPMPGWPVTAAPESSNH